MAEVALRCGRLLGMFARLSGVPWLLIEICARSLGYGCVSGVFHGPLSATETNGRSSMTAQRDMAWVGIDVGKTHHWACMVDVEGKKLLSIKVANDEADIVALIADGRFASDTGLFGPSTSSVRHRRCCWPCWLEPTSRCVMHPGESSRR